MLKLISASPLWFSSFIAVICIVLGRFARFIFPKKIVKKITEWAKCGKLKPSIVVKNVVRIGIFYYSKANAHTILISIFMLFYGPSFSIYSLNTQLLFCYINLSKIFYLDIFGYNNNSKKGLHKCYANRVLS